MKKSKLSQKLPQIEVKSIKENPDGSSTMDFEVDDAFIELFKKQTGVKKYSKRKLEKFVLDILTKSLENKDGYKLQKEKE